MAGATHLTGEDCRKIAAAIDAVMRRIDIDLTGSVLGDHLAEADWLGSFEGNVLFSGAWDPPNRDRTSDAASLVLRLKRVAWALTVASQLPGFDRRVRLLRDLHVRLRAPQGDATDEGLAGQAWDLLFEIELAAQLHGGPYVVSFEEPDVVLTFEGDGRRLGLACKRPRKLSTVPDRVGNAVRQIAEFDGAGFVVLSLDLLVRAGRSAQHNWVIVDHDRKVEETCARAVGEAMAGIASRVGDVFHRAGDRSPEEMANVGGVLGIANLCVLAGLDGGQRYINTKTVTSILPLLGAVGAGKLLEGLCRLIELGQAEFRSDQWLRAGRAPAA